MENKVLNTIKQYNMICHGDNILVALSGGADSVALFYAMLSLRQRLGIIVFAAHLNHGLRGAESDGDEAFVRNLCKQYNVELFVKNEYMAQKTAPQGMGTEEWARVLRYDFLQNTAKSLNAKLATAHTLSDNCETLLFHLCRGTSVHGAAGIPPVRGNIIRPLINVTRHEVEAYCKANGLDYVTDSSNLADDYSRNKLRHHVIPVMQQISPSAQQAMGRFLCQQQSIDSYLQKKAENLLKNSETTVECFSTEIFEQEDILIQQIAVVQLISRFIQPEHIKIDLCMQTLKNKTGAVQLNADKYFCVTKSKIYIKTKTSLPKPQYEIPFEIKKFNLEGGYTFKAEIIRCKETINFVKIHKKAFNYMADYDKIQDSVLLRTRRQGDIFTMQGRFCTKTLKKLFNELAIPLEKRDNLPVIANKNNVLWIYDIGFAQELAINKQTKNILFITNINTPQEISDFKETLKNEQNGK